MILSRVAKNAGSGMQRLVDRLFYTKIGAIVVSGIFGMALALMFQRVCKDRKCIVIQSPPTKEVTDYVYQVGKDVDSCYMYAPRVVKCA